MEDSQGYYSIKKFDLSKISNIEEKSLIHQFGNKQSALNVEHIENKQILNELR